jgi:hypothetical protein
MFNSYYNKYAWRRHEMGAKYTRAEMAAMLKSLSDLLMPEMETGGRSSIILEKTEKMQAHRAALAKKFYEDDYQNNGRTLEQVYEDGEGHIVEMGICQVLQTAYEFKDSIDKSNVHDYGKDIVDPNTGFKLEVKRQVWENFDRFQYCDKYLHSFEKAAWEGACDFGVAAHIEEYDEFYIINPTLIFYAPSYFTFGEYDQAAPGAAVDSCRMFYYPTVKHSTFGYFVENVPHLNHRRKMERERKASKGLTNDADNARKGIGESARGVQSRTDQKESGLSESAQHG